MFDLYILVASTGNFKKTWQINAVSGTGAHRHYSLDGKITSRMNGRAKSRTSLYKLTMIGGQTDRKMTATAVYGRAKSLAEYVQRPVLSSLHENVVFSVCAPMGNDAYIISIMWNSISGLDI